MSMTTRGGHSLVIPPGNVPTRHTVDLTAQASTTCAIPSIIGSVLQSHERKTTIFISSCFLF